MSWLTGNSKDGNIWGGVGNAIHEVGGAFHSGHGVHGLIDGVTHAVNDASTATKPIQDDVSGIQSGVGAITKNVGDGMTATKPGIGQITKGFSELGHGGLNGLIQGGTDMVNAAPPVTTR